MVSLEQIRSNLQEAIKLSGKTQTAIAQQLGIKHQTVQQYVSGRAMPALDTFANLCLILDLSADDLLGINDSGGRRTVVANSFNGNTGNITFKG